MVRLSCPVCEDAAVIGYDSSAGNVVCTTCGFAVDDNIVISDITFGESSTGAAVLQISSLDATDPKARTVGPRTRPQVSDETRSQTLESGMHKILGIARGLNLSDGIAESAHRFFTLAVSEDFAMGGHSPYVLASCIYVACRMKKLPTMLIDLSDFLQINVFIVGETYLRLVEELCPQQIPHIDPSLYISRFAALLEFGSETEKVAYDATRLVRRFDYDWITSGRQASGIAGACLFISARMNNFKRSVLEIVQVVKIADFNIKESLKDFENFRVGKMTVESFRNKWLEESEDPQAFERDKKRKKQTTNKASKRIKTGDAQEKGKKDEEEKERAKDEHGSSQATSVVSGPIVIRNSNDTSRNLTTKPFKGRDRAKNDGSETQDWIFGSEISNWISGPAIEAKERWYEKQVECAITQEVEAHLISGAGSRIQSELDQEEFSKKKNQEKGDLSEDLDEEELDLLILGDQEVEMKTRAWMELNTEYLQDLAEKEHEGSGEVAPTKIQYTSSLKVKPIDLDDAASAVTIGESVSTMMNSKNLALRNYAIADSLVCSKIEDKHKIGERRLSLSPTKEVREKAEANLEHSHSALLDDTTKV